MALKRWRVVAVAAVLLGGITVPFVPEATAGTTLPDGGGYPHAGAPPGTLGAATTMSPALPSGYTVRGIDVSSHDHPSGRAINWSAVAGSGVKFAYIKATEGLSYANPYFGGDGGVQADYAGAHNAGLYVGAYHFGRPDRGNPVGQADYFMDHAGWGPDSKTLVPFLDIEWPYLSGYNNCWNLTPGAMAAWIRAFVDEVKARIGRSPMIYTNRYWWNQCVPASAPFGDTSLNLASYTSTPPTPPSTWSTFAIWQYAAGDPATGAFDRDVINGDLTALSLLAGPTAPTVISLRAHANGAIVTGERAGSLPLIANRTGIGTWEQFDKVDLGGGNIALRSHVNGHYVTAESAGARPLIANRMAIGGWEIFRLITNADGSVSLRAAANGRYVTAESAGARPLIANRTAIGGWEMFDAMTSPTVISLRAKGNGRYVTADNGGALPLIATKTAIGTWERFLRYDLGGGRVAVRAAINGKAVAAESAGARPLIANRVAIGPWEIFTILHNGDGSVSLRAAANGRYVTADSAGTRPLIASRTGIGLWEEFDIL